jgi:GT2 family glycosyltransferase
MFDATWYLQHNADVGATNIDPALHYLRYGAREGRNPSPYFDSEWYLQQNPDVRSAGANPLVHYLKHGSAEGRHPNPFNVVLAAIDPKLPAVRPSAPDSEPPNRQKEVSRKLQHTSIGSLLAVCWQILRIRSLSPLRDWSTVRIIQRSKMFAPGWYMSTNPDVAAQNINPLWHFVLFGAREGRDPSPSFSTRDYLARYPDVAVAKINPLAHFILYGVTEGRLSNFTGTSDPSGARRASQRATLVSVIIVNYNGIRHLTDLFNSLRWLKYKNYEILMVDNASTDESVEFARSNYPNVNVLQLKDNVGFAEANNIGAELSRGEYIFVLNNDTRCDPACLDYLVEALDRDSELGAVGPKILFWTKFSSIEVSISSFQVALLDLDELQTVFPNYEKIFFREGFSEPFVQEGRAVRRLSGNARFLVPSDRISEGIALHLYPEGGSVTVTIRIGSRASEYLLNPGVWQIVQVNADEYRLQQYWIINNAGSDVSHDGRVSDRGFGQVDDGTFDVSTEVAALCGCAMLIRRSALKPYESLFARELFAYFEDTDLSLRIRSNGHRLAYCPKSVVYHKHASTARENSTFFRYYVTRNKILFYALHFPSSFWQQKLREAREELNHLRWYYKTATCTAEEQSFCQKIPEIFADWDRLLPQIAANRFYGRKVNFPHFAVYNSFWNSKGGGEYHAGVIAEALQRLGPVDLICEQQFDIEDIEQQFNLNLSNCRKVIVRPTELHHNKHVTGQYELFVNSTFGSDLISHAERSLYLVSFPFRLEDRTAVGTRFIESYDLFLANSNYTKAWCERFWHVRAKTLYPCVNENGYVAVFEPKKKIILNVGRFFWSGHCKKQRELVQSFKELVNEGMLDSEWRLVLAGQVEQGQEIYFDEVCNLAQGAAVELYPNASREKLSKLYGQAAIYWHATGLGEDLDRFPERAEHFGIATIEAMAWGCIPIVIQAGGQPEIVTEGKDGYLFADTCELKGKTQFVAKMFDDQPNGLFSTILENARARAREFSKTQLQQHFLMLVKTGETAASIGKQIRSVTEKATLTS